MYNIFIFFYLLFLYSIFYEKKCFSDDLYNINFPIIEDLLISYFYYEKLVGLGFKFPTPEMAASFSVELAESCYGFGPNTSFGFHGEELKQIIYKSILNEF